MRIAKFNISTFNPQVSLRTDIDNLGLEVFGTDSQRNVLPNDDRGR
jgi:hypothetical protein